MGLEMADIFMLVVLVLAGAASVFVVVNKNVVHSALSLVVVMLGVAGAFLLMGAEFLAWTQVLVYAGAVIVLILFGLMLTRAPIGPMREDSENARLAFGVSVALFGFLMSLIIVSFNGVELNLSVTPTIALAEFLYVEWAFPLLAMGFLLTVALVGAVIIARAEEGEGPLPDDEDFIDSGEAPPIRSGDSVAEPGYSIPSTETAPVVASGRGGQ
ncbi:NADH-quinone oxidoreductase subunit J [Euzebya tangerina]|uniref:NADH-quinone oxidoreductase subunit J family protein n=1 Tax=Euzebya tangerina TaxID=591198 RepID=UPI000E316DB3|nr:NADH-quinone oxidoreductase subunit J [Euzebya tangerina]